MPASGGDYDVDAGSALAGFRTCPVCALLAPPRSHHCHVCGRCVLRRDHHCFFTASCVGHANQRYFVVFTFYATVSCALGAVLIARHLTTSGTDCALKVE